MFSHKKHDPAKDLAFFDVRLKTHGFHNTVLVKGNDVEIENVPLEGHVKLLTKLDLHVKRIKLVLTGEQTLDYYSKSSDGTSGGLVSEKNCVMRVVWPNLLCSAKGELQYGDYAHSAIKLSKAEGLAKRSIENSAVDLKSLGNDSNGGLGPGSPAPGQKPEKNEGQKRPGFHKTKSQPILFKNHETSLVRIPKAGIDGTPCPEYAALGPKSDARSFLLPNGNYLMPFSVVLPANTPESVDGLSIGKIRYKLECHIERGRFDRPFKKARFFRIVRTLHSRNMNRFDSIDFSNTWPGKIDFNVSMPKKGLALGSTVPIKLVIVPLIKGLSFKSMYAEIVQHSSVAGLYGPLPVFEHVIGKKKVTCSSKAVTEDHWVIKGTYELPASLADITQSCTLKNDLVSVRHRVRVQIHIRNADGHVLELRANLPVIVYLSPNQRRVVSRHWEVDAAGSFIAGADPEKVDHVFPQREQNTEEQPENLEPVATNEEEAEEEDEEDAAPPVYTQHMKDLVYDYNSVRTPIEQLRANSGTATPIDGYFDLPVNRSKAASPMPDLTKLSKIPCYEEALETDSDEDGEMPAPQYIGDSPFSLLALNSALNSAATSGLNSPAPSTRKTSIPRPSLSERSISMTNVVMREKQLPAKKLHLFGRKEKK